MVRILNIVTDQKFIDRVIEKHDALDSFSTHDYVIVGGVSTFHYIKKTERIKFVPKDVFIDFINRSDYAGILIHNLPSLPFELIPLIPNKIKVFWQIWGFDIYSRPYDSPFVKVNQYHLLNKDYLKRNTTLKSKLKGFLKRALGITARNCSLYNKAVSRVNYISGILPFEYGLIKKAHPELSAKQFHYAYAFMGELRSKEDVLPCVGTSILVGNSADMSNNHLDVFELLRKANLNGREVIVPLSYSGSKKYVETVVKEGTSIFGNDLKPLTSFMPLEEYSKMLSACGYCIFYHERQQAVGNIELMLRMGSKVFLSETNPTYAYYKGLGIHVFTIQNDLSEASLSTPLTQKQVDENVSILRKLYSVESETQKLKDLCSLCSESE